MKKKKHLPQILETLKQLLALATYMAEEVYFKWKEDCYRSQAWWGSAVTSVLERLRQEAHKVQGHPPVCNRSDLKDKKDRKHIYTEILQTIYLLESKQNGVKDFNERKESVRKPMGLPENTPGTNRNQTTRSWSHSSWSKCCLQSELRKILIIWTGCRWGSPSFWLSWLPIQPTLAAASCSCLCAPAAFQSLWHSAHRSQQLP